MHLQKDILFASNPSNHIERLINNLSYEVLLNKIFFDASSKIDKRHYDYLRKMLPKKIFENIVVDLLLYNQKSHATLITYLKEGYFYKIFEL